MKKIFLVLIIFVTSLNAGEKFSELAWERIDPIYKAILKHPFNQKLALGTLDKSIFDFYTGQDGLYLVEFRKALALLAAKLEGKAQRQVLREVIGTLDDEPEHPAEEMAPFTQMYTDFLLSTAAFKSREELAAALLPCFWIYLRAARELAPQVTSSNPYKSWFDLYSSKKYELSVNTMIQLTDELASENSMDKMLKAFELASRMEWLFWDGAYRMRLWPFSTTVIASPAGL